MVHLSNVLGSVLPAERVCEMAHQVGTRRHWLGCLKQLAAHTPGRIHHLALSAPCIASLCPLLPEQVGALVLLDACQFLPHRVTDVQALGCDWLVASGHKMLAPTAIGFLWGRWGAGLDMVRAELSWAWPVLHLCVAGISGPCCPPLCCTYPGGRQRISNKGQRVASCCRYELLGQMEPLMVGGSTTGEIHFGRHTDLPPPLRCDPHFDGCL
jgi:hypothetical protein